MRYENEKCPFCGEIFKENDEVVVCPECATPHHRACFSENGQCVNTHLHSEGFVWQRTEKTEEVKETVSEEKSEDETVTCPECGCENKKNALICSECGNILAPIEEKLISFETNPVYIDGRLANDNDFIDEEGAVTVKEAACFIQGRKESYIKTFLDAKVNHRKPKFNFSAFLMGPLWFFFRKIYKAGFAFAGVIFAVCCVIMTFFVRVYGEAMGFFMQNMEAFMQETVDTALYEEYINLVIDGINNNMTEVYLMYACILLLLVVNVVAGIVANRIYLSHIKTSVGKVKEISPNARAYYTYLYAKGGTSILNAFMIGLAISYLMRFIFSQALK